MTRTSEPPPTVSVPTIAPTMRRMVRGEEEREDERDASPPQIANRIADLVDHQLNNSGAGQWQIVQWRSARPAMERRHDDSTLVGAEVECASVASMSSRWASS